MTPEKSKESKAEVRDDLEMSLSDATDGIIEEQENGDWLITNIDALDEAIMDWHNKQQDKLIDRVLEWLSSALNDEKYYRNDLFWDRLFYTDFKLMIEKLRGKV